MVGWICSKKGDLSLKDQETPQKKIYICIVYLFMCIFRFVLIYISYTCTYAYTYTSSIHVFRAFFAVDIGECLGIPKD